MISDLQFIRDSFVSAIPKPPEKSVCEWGKKHVRLIGSARSEAFDPDITPWLKEPLETSEDGVTKICTVVGPIQSAKSTIGEVALLRRLSKGIGGDVQYNWEDDEKAGERFDGRIDRTFLACAPLRALMPQERTKKKRCFIAFPHCNFTMQGAFSRSNLSSNSIAFQVNEELHGWKPGHLKLAYGRTTAFWNPYILNLSNAGYKGDQLHEALEAGTNQAWEVKCPGCGLYHAMRTEWKETEPHLGGLRYDSDGCKRKDGTYDYNKMESTIRIQMPCGYPVYEDSTVRRQLSLSGRYGAPRNTGAHISNKSFTMEAVSVDYIPLILLVQEKHAALKAMRYGDQEPFITYLRERECRFWDPEDRPLMGRIELSTEVKKNREGLPGRHARYFALDRQQGDFSKGELPHWWLVIRDAMKTADSQLVFEGRVDMDEDVIAKIDEHGCLRRHGVADSGDDTTHVYKFCLRYGISAVKGSGETFFSHGKNGGRRIFSVEKPLHKMLGIPPTKANPLDEPLFFFYSKVGILERLAWLRSGARKWVVPADVSDDYKAHMESWDLKEGIWEQVKKRDDLLFCEAYIALQMDRAGLIGTAAGEQDGKQLGKQKE